MRSCVIRAKLAAWRVVGDRIRCEIDEIANCPASACGGTLVSAGQSALLLGFAPCESELQHSRARRRLPHGAIAMLIAVQSAIAAIVALAYLMRCRALRASSQRPARWRSTCFYAGIAISVAAIVALEGRGREEVYVATVLLVLVGDLAALLITLGLTGAVLRPLRSAPLIGRLRVLALPSVALPLWIINMAVWHLPGPWEAALHHRSLMLLQHLLFAAAGIAVWAALIGPGAGERWRQRPGSWLAYALFWRILFVALGTGGIVSPIVFYSHYVQTDVSFTMSPLSDQGIAGSILIGESAIIAIGLLLLLYVRIGGESSSSGASADPPPVEAGETGLREQPALASESSV
jgi:putative membrane protein